MTIKYLTLNIWNGGIFFDAALNFLISEDADIIALQEVYYGTDPTLERRYRTMTELAAALPHTHHAFAPVLIDTTGGISVVRGNAVFSKFPIAHAREIFYDKPFGAYPITVEYAESQPFNLQHVVVEVGGASLNVFNTHGVWGRDGEDNPRRLHMSDVIVGEVRGRSRTILSGDFNVKDHTETVQRIAQHMRHIFRGELETTFNLKQKDAAKFAHAVVDMIFVSPDLRVVERWAPQVDVSDHMPLVCTIEV